MYSLLKYNASPKKESSSLHSTVLAGFSVSTVLWSELYSFFWQAVYLWKILNHWIRNSYPSIFSRFWPIRIAKTWSWSNIIQIFAVRTFISFVNRKPERNKKCIFVGSSCAVYRERYSKNPALSDKPHDKPTNLFFRLNTLCTHLSGSSLWYLNKLPWSWVIMQNLSFCTLH